MLDIERTYCLINYLFNALLLWLHDDHMLKKKKDYNHDIASHGDLSRFRFLEPHLIHTILTNLVYYVMIRFRNSYA